MISSRSTNPYASTARLLNCLVLSLVMATIALASLPFFLAQNIKNRPGNRTVGVTIHPAKFTPHQKHADGTLILVSRPQKKRAIRSQLASPGPVEGSRPSYFPRKRSFEASPEPAGASGKPEIKRGEPDET